MDKIGLLLDFASKGKVEAVEKLLDEGLDVDSRDYDGRTAMHLAASEGHYEVIKLLLSRNAHVNPVDRWRKTPLADARRYLQNSGSEKRQHYQNVRNVLMKSGATTSSPLEIDPAELKFLDSKESVCKCEFGEIKLANWRGTNVSAQILDWNLPLSNSPRSELHLLSQLSILQSCRHPNIVQFLGAVTNHQNKSIVLVTEHLPNGNLLQYLQSVKGRIRPKEAVSYALDIARGMNYLHQHKTNGIIHGELNPMNLSRDAAGHLKVAGIGLSRLIGCICLDASQTEIQKTMYSHSGKAFDYSRYIAPELLDKHSAGTRNKSVDVYSFGRIVHELFQVPRYAERPRRPNSQSQVAAFSRCNSENVPVSEDVPVTPRPRPAMTRTCPRTSFPPKMRELLDQCLAANPKERPSFQTIIRKLDEINETVVQRQISCHAFINSLSDVSTNCILKAKKVWNGSIVPSIEDSFRGGRSRREAAM